MSDEKGWRAIVKLNAPPTAQYESGDSIILQGDDLAQIDLMLNSAQAITNPLLRRILDAHVGAQPVEAAAPAPVAAAPVAAPAAVAAPTPTLTPEQVAAILQQGQVPAQAPAAAPAPVPAPGGGSNRPPKVDGSQVGGTPGQRYPVGAQLGGPCPKDNVITYWQEAFTNPNTKEYVNAYWRCPNAKNHPRNG